MWFVLIAFVGAALASEDSLIGGVLATSACPSGYSPINGTDDCFRIYNIAKAFAEAEAFCQDDGAHLASIHSNQEMLGLNDILGSASALIGIKCTTLTSCTWSDGTPYDYQNFIYGQPTLEYGSCAHLYTYDDKFYSWNCATPMNAFLCRVKTTSQDTSCSPGYTPLGDSCVAVKTNPRTAYDAEDECELEGGHLASIHSYAGNTLMTNLLFDANLTANAHIGMRYNQSYGYYFWTDDSDYDYRNWATPEFPNSRFGACSQLLVTDEFGSPGTWTNVPCETKLPYICMKAKGVSPTYAPMICPSMQYFDDRGTVYSPGFPLTVPSKLHCEYLLTGELGSTLVVSFPYFSTDRDSKLTLYDGMSVARPMAVLTGALENGITFYTTQNLMKMVFETSAKTGGEGWEAAFATYSSLTTTRVPPMTSPTKVPPTSIYPTTAVIPKTTVNSNCPSQTLYADVQVSSPGFPYGYPRNANCLFFLSGQPGKKLLIDFEYINTKRDKDYVSIRDGPFAYSTEIGRVSGLTYQNTPRYVSSSNYLTLVFVSDGTKGETGWTATVDSVF